MTNPWMSLWLSGANAMRGTVFGQAASIGRRQMDVMASKAAEDMLSLWLSAWVPPAPRRRKKSR